MKKTFEHSNKYSFNFRYRKKSILFKFSSIKCVLPKALIHLGTGCVFRKIKESNQWNYVGY